jgi:hypothetical protein
LEIEKDMQPPIALVYIVENAYINHRKYIDSVSPDQLAGKTIDFNKANKECTPFATNSNMNHSTSYSGAPLDPAFVASPCGFTGTSPHIQPNFYSTIPTNCSAREENKYPSIRAASSRTSTASSRSQPTARAPNGPTPPTITS